MPSNATNVALAGVCPDQSKLSVLLGSLESRGDLVRVHCRLDAAGLDVELLRRLLLML